MTLRLLPLAAVLILVAIPCVASDFETLSTVTDVAEPQLESVADEVAAAPDQEAEDVIFPLDFAKSLEIATTSFGTCGFFPCISQTGCRNNCLSRNCATYLPQCFPSGHCFCDLR